MYGLRMTVMYAELLRINIMIRDTLRIGGEEI